MIDYQRFIRAASLAQAMQGHAVTLQDILKQIETSGAWATPAEAKQMLKTLEERGEIVWAFGERYVVHLHSRTEILKGYEYNEQDDPKAMAHKKMKEEHDRLAAEYNNRVKTRKAKGGK